MNFYEKAYSLFGYLPKGRFSSTSDNINLSMEENPKEELQLELYNISGQLILEKRLPSFEKEHRIDVQNLPSGVYLVKLWSDNQLVYSSKIIKE